jgi:hypothetical protein
VSAALDHGIVVRRMILESLRLEGKVAIITGGDEAMRRAIALRQKAPTSPSVIVPTAVALRTSCPPLRVTQQDRELGAGRRPKAPGEAGRCVGRFPSFG